MLQRYPWCRRYRRRAGRAGNAGSTATTGTAIGTGDDRTGGLRATGTGGASAAEAPATPVPSGVVARTVATPPPLTGATGARRTAVHRAGDVRRAGLAAEGARRSTATVGTVGTVRTVGASDTGVGENLDVLERDARTIRGTHAVDRATGAETSVGAVDLEPVEHDVVGEGHSGRRAGGLDVR